MFPLSRIKLPNRIFYSQLKELYNLSIYFLPNLRKNPKNDRINVEQGWLINEPFYIYDERAKPRENANARLILRVHGRRITARPIRR